MKHFYKLLFLMFATSALHASPSSIVTSEDVEKNLDTLNVNLEEVDKMVRNNLFTSGSSPVMFTGEARIKLTDTYWGDRDQSPAGFLDLDRHRLSFWEGNESAVRIAMLARPTGNVILWSKLGFNTTFAGHYLSKYGSTPSYLTSKVDDSFDGDFDGLTREQYNHDKDNQAIYLQEDMNAGIAIRYEAVSFWARMGHTIWTQASPFTIWKAQPRNFAWDYLPFEIEQPIERYYDYNIAKGIKEGRAAWNKKPFQGIQLESIKLPSDLYLNLMYTKYENYDNFEREYVDYATDRGYAYSTRSGFLDSYQEVYKSKGINDTYRWLTHARLAKPFGDHTFGLNYMAFRYDEDFALLGLSFASPENNDQYSANSPGQNPKQIDFYAEGPQGFNFWKDITVGSFDGEGQVNNNLSYKFDVAVSQVDSQFFYLKEGYASKNTIDTGKKVVLGEKRNSGFNPAVYAEVKYNNSILPVTLMATYIDKKFYSPFSFVAAHEAMTPYGSNLLGAGKFIARGEASPYTPNMMGANFFLNPIVPDGHLKFNIGMHTQPEDGFNAIYFPYILNGIVLSTAVANSTTRWGNGSIDGTIGEEGKAFGSGIGFNPYYQRLGLGNQQILAKGLGDKGGLFADFLSAYEGFIAFENADAARTANLKGAEYGSGEVKYRKNDSMEDPEAALNDSVSNFVNMLNQNGQVATIQTTSFGGKNISYMKDISEIDGIMSKKYTHNYSVDWTVNINRYLGFEKKFYLNSYLGYYELGTSPTPTFNWSDDNTKVMLGGNIARFEAAFQLTKQFYIIGVGGIENWYSHKSYMASMNYVTADSTKVAVLPGIEYIDYIQDGSAAIDKSTIDVKQVDIDYRDIVFGVGFDWDFMKRVGFHFRASRNIHQDKAIQKENVLTVDGDVIEDGTDVNGYNGNVISGELKMFF